jgi:hypothetical protein
MKNKKGIEFSFGWLFALIVGAAILFLAIYATIKLVGTERTAQEAEAAKQLEIILTPVETGYEEGKAVTPIIFPSETRIYNNCSTEGNFGEQSIRVATSINLGKSWQDEGIPTTSYNKYIFSPGMMQGLELYAFSKPFEMPFKTANVLFMWTSKYCFVNTPTEIEKEITSLNLKKINVTDNINNCDKNSKKVCFVSDLAGCDVFVDPIQKIARQKGKKAVFYEGSLIYGAILSEPEVYECQVKRLMKRTSELALLYNAKSENIAARASGCSSDLQGDLKNLAMKSGQLNNSMELRDIYFLSAGLENAHKKITSCKLWGE